MPYAVIHEKIGIVKGMITTVHCVTNTQVVVDLPHKDLRRARSCLTSLVPTTTGSATAITVIFPELKGKLNGHAIRVPLLNASITDAVFTVARPTTVTEVNALLKEASETYLKGVLGFEVKPLVGEDFRNDPRSSIVDAGSTMVVADDMVKIYAWYDNEWG
jgi:glyceraldehyde 3-phosphate dehydrogenase